jgi:hypothetical protein
VALQDGFHTAALSTLNTTDLWFMEGAFRWATRGVYDAMSDARLVDDHNPSKLVH